MLASRSREWKCAKTSSGPRMGAPRSSRRVAMRRPISRAATSDAALAGRPRGDTGVESRAARFKLQGWPRIANELAAYGNNVSLNFVIWQLAQNIGGQFGVIWFYFHGMFPWDVLCLNWEVLFVVAD